jgi:hypothetical protein
MVPLHFQLLESSDEQAGGLIAVLRHVGRPRWISRSPSWTPIAYLPSTMSTEVKWEMQWFVRSRRLVWAPFGHPTFSRDGTAGNSPHSSRMHSQPAWPWLWRNFERRPRLTSPRARAEMTSRRGGTNVGSSWVRHLRRLGACRDDGRSSRPKGLDVNTEHVRVAELHRGSGAQSIVVEQGLDVTELGVSVEDESAK